MCRALRTFRRHPRCSLEAFFLRFLPSWAEKRLSSVQIHFDKVAKNKTEVRMLEERRGADGGAPLLPATPLFKKGIFLVPKYVYGGHRSSGSGVLNLKGSQATGIGGRERPFSA